MQTIIARWPAPHNLPLVLAPAATPQVPSSPLAGEVGAQRREGGEGTTVREAPSFRSFLLALGPAPAAPRRRDPCLAVAILAAASACLCAAAFALAAFGLHHGWWN